MKKTIAILLVLIIGMAGVFAADLTANLNLITTVYEFNEMIITEENDVTWTPFGEGQKADVNARSTYTGTTAETRKSIDPYTTDAQAVGYLHTRTNLRRGYTVKVKATQLSSLDETTQEIDYSIFNGGESPVYTTAATPPVAVTFVEQESGTGMRLKSTPISVLLLATGDELSAGVYTGDITFEYTAL